MALIVAAVLASWCASVFGGDTAQAQSPPLYPKGVWCPFGPYEIIPPALLANMGIVGLNVSEDWSDINTAPGVYDWSALDDEVAQAVAAGFKVNITINNGSDKTPQWLLDSLPRNQKISLLDPAPNHSTFCQPIETALYWNPVFHQARLDLIAAAGAHFASNPAIQGFMASFANHHSNDWNIQDTVGTIFCPACPQPSPTQCGHVVVDQVQQWLDAGWTEQAMLEVGKDICDAAAAAFPNQNIKLPIGVTDSILGATDPGRTNGTQTTLCRDIEDYVYGNESLGIPPRPYANRFFMQRNSFAADWNTGDYWDTHTPDFDNDNYVKYMIRAHAHPNPPWTIPGQAGLQMIDSATNGPLSGCRLDGGPDGPCGPLCDPVCVMQTSLDVSLTYGGSFIEIFQDDAVNPLLYAMVRATTLALGGAPRDATPTPTPTASPTPTPTPTPTVSADFRVTVTDAKITVVSGARNTYNVVVKNLGPNEITGGSVSDIFPAIFTGVTFTATQTGGASGFTASGTGNINDTVTMPNGSAITYKATGTVSGSGGSISDTATVTVPNGVFDPNLVNNSATDTDTIQPSSTPTPTPTPTSTPPATPTPTPTPTPSADLRVTVTDKKTTIVAGSRNTYTVVVKNLGPNNVTGGSVSDIFPAIFTDVTFTATATGGASGFTASGTGNINDTVTMPNGSGITYKATGTISTSAHGSISDTATVTTPNGVFDPNSANNSATDTDTIQ